LGWLFALYAFAIFGYITVTNASYLVGRATAAAQGDGTASNEVAALRADILALRTEVATLVVQSQRAPTSVFQEQHVAAINGLMVTYVPVRQMRQQGQRYLFQQREHGGDAYRQVEGGINGSKRNTGTEFACRRRNLDHNQLDDDPTDARRICCTYSVHRRCHRRIHHLLLFGQERALGGAAVGQTRAAQS
jgi:hypothetical protein